MKTSAGDMEIELFENEAPNTVLNFITLVEKGFYDGLKFHRVLPGFMAQGGDPKGTGGGGPGYTIPCECYREDHRLHFRGSLSMAHAAATRAVRNFPRLEPTKFLTENIPCSAASLKALTCWPISSGGIPTSDGRRSRHDHQGRSHTQTEAPV